MRLSLGQHQTVCEKTERTGPLSQIRTIYSESRWVQEMPGELAAAPHPHTGAACGQSQHDSYTAGLRCPMGNALMTKSETLSVHVSQKTQLTEQNKSCTEADRASYSCHDPQ